MAKAAVTRSIRDDHQKNFLKIFNVASSADLPHSCNAKT